MQAEINVFMQVMQIYALCMCTRAGWHTYCVLWVIKVLCIKKILTRWAGEYKVKQQMCIFPCLNVKIYLGLGYVLGLIISLLTCMIWVIKMMHLILKPNAIWLIEHYHKPWYPESPDVQCDELHFRGAIQYWFNIRYSLLIFHFKIRVPCLFDFNI